MVDYKVLWYLARGRKKAKLVTARSLHCSPLEKEHVLVMAKDSDDVDRDLKLFSTEMANNLVS